MHDIRWSGTSRRVKRAHRRDSHASAEQTVSVCVGRQVQLRSDTRKITALRKRNSVQIPLRVATIERVYIGGRTGRDEPTLDSTPAGQAGDFFAGAESA